MLQLSYLFLAVLLVSAYRLGPTLSRLTRLPLITLYMLGGVLASHSGLLAEQVLEQLMQVARSAQMSFVQCMLPSRTAAAAFVPGHLHRR